MGLYTDDFADPGNSHDEGNPYNEIMCGLPRNLPYDSNKSKQYMTLEAPKEIKSTENERKKEERRVFIVPQPEKPTEFCRIQKIMTAPLTSQITDKYFIPYTDESTRSDSSCPDKRIISRTHCARMKQLVEFFPDGIAADHFIDLYAKILGQPPTLNGYTFPKDNDNTTNFHLRSVFWIPDNDVYHLPKRLLFPVESLAKYNGSLKTLLQAYWHLLVKYIGSKEAIDLRDFDIDDNDELFHSETGIWFSYKRWGLLTYINFFELILENFDPDNIHYTILRLPSDEPGILRQRVFLVVSGKDGEFAREFEKKANERVYEVTESATKQEPILMKQRAAWTLEEMNFKSVDFIREKTYDSRVFDVVTAGNIKDFYLFHVLRIKDIQARDDLLKTINELVLETASFTIPDPIIEKYVVMFLNTRNKWRRGVILDHNKTNNTVKVLDIDTGETTPKVAVNYLRNICSKLIHLPVLTIPVRFSVHRTLQQFFIGNSEGNRVLGKYLHMMLVEANKGLRLRFFRWDREYTHYIPGVWVVKGFLIDVIKNTTISPRVSISDYLLAKFKTRRPNEVLPEWQEECDDIEEEEDWSTPIMQQRLSNISYMIRYYTGPGEIRRNNPLFMNLDPTISTELDVDNARKNVPVAAIFQDEEYGNCQKQLRFVTKQVGFRGTYKSNIILHNLGDKKMHKDEIKKHTPSSSNEDDLITSVKSTNAMKFIIKTSNLETIEQKMIIDHSQLSPNDISILQQNFKRKSKIKIPVTVMFE